MATGIIGEVFTFQVLFLNESNEPIAVDSPTVKIYYFDDDGEEEILQDETGMTAVSGDTGRYVYPYTIPDTFISGQVIYGLMNGIDPDTEVTITSEETVDLVVAGFGGIGLVARFVRCG